MKRQRIRLGAEWLESRDLLAIFAVAPTGNDGSGTGAAAAPFRTIQRAVNQANNGDTVLVAAGTYTYDASQETSVITGTGTKSVVAVANKNIKIYGGYTTADGFKASNPQANATIIDGQDQFRNMFIFGVGPTAASVGVEVQGITFQNGRGLAIPARGDLDSIFGFGGGVFIDLADNTAKTTPNSFVFRNVTFQNNKAIGSPGVPSNPQLNFGGAGTGGAIAARDVARLVVENAVFQNNQALGGNGNERGGVGNGGAIHLDRSAMTGNNLLFENNKAICGTGTGSGRDSRFNELSDATGGAVSVQISSKATLTNVIARNNQAIAGDAADFAGSAIGGAFFTELGDLSIVNGIIADNLTQGGRGNKQGGLSIGGGIHTDKGDLVIDRVRFTGNKVIGGTTSSTGTFGAVAGGAMNLTRLGTDATARGTVTVTNSLIANNRVELAAGAGARNNAGGSGAGVTIQGTNAAFSNVTVANNTFGINILYGQAFNLNDNAVPAGLKSTLTLNNSIVANHTGATMDAFGKVEPIGSATAVHVFPNAVLNVNNAIFFDNTNNLDQGIDDGIAPGTYNGVGTIKTVDPAFTAPGTDFSLKAGSPAVDASTNSTVSVDLSNSKRVFAPDIGAFELGTFGTAPTIAAPTGAAITTGPAGFDPNDPGQNTAPSISEIADAKVAIGATLGPITFVINDAQTAPADLKLSVTSSDTKVVPISGITFGGSGGNRTVTVVPAAGVEGVTNITVTVTDALGLATSEPFRLVVGNPVLTNPVLVGFPQLGAGQDSGGSQVKLYNADGSTRFSASPFGDFTGGVRTATADFNGDGIADLIAGTGPGKATQVVVLNGVTQAVLKSIDPFEASFTGGVYVSAGDVNGDGTPDLAITPDEGGGPRVDVYSGKDFVKIASFFGIDDTNFRGGARSAIGDMNGDLTADLIVVAGFGGGPRVAGFDGKTVGTATPRKIFGDFFSFEQTLRNGVFVTVGDVNGDGFADLIAGGGPGGGPRVLIFSGSDLIKNVYTPLANFFGGDTSGRGGIRLAIKNLDNDGFADLVVGSGTGSGSRATAYLGKTISSASPPPTTLDFDAFSGFGGGVFVG